MSVVNQNTLVEGKKDIFSLSLGNRYIYVSVERKKLEKVQIIPPYYTHIRIKQENNCVGSESFGTKILTDI